jgi:hypothetical protein
LIRKSLLAFEAGFEATLNACEDFHFYFRLVRHTSVGIINNVNMLRRLHKSNMSSNWFNMGIERIRSRTLLKESEKDPEVQKHLNRYIAYCKGDMARCYADHGRFLESFQYDWQVLTGPFFWPEMGRSCRNILRTIAMAAGLKRRGMA